MPSAGSTWTAHKSQSSPCSGRLLTLPRLSLTALLYAPCLLFFPSLMQGDFLYFAYGSNMGHRRLQARTPSARFVAIARVSGYRLVFHKAGWDGSAKADCLKTGNESNDIVYGALYNILNTERRNLDEAEGAGFAYRAELINVYDVTHKKPVQALVYIAIEVQDGLVAHDWYMHHVLFGAKEIGLPADYIKMIESFPVKEDKDRARRAREMSIYSN